LFKHLQLKHFRSVCSEVVPGKLFIASYGTASNLEALQKNKITHIVNTAADICDVCFPDKFQYCVYYLKDINQEEISLLIYRTIEWIQNAIDSRGRVLVHCREGVSRSATMVIAYLMWQFNLSFEAAHERIRKARPICNPNTGFTCQLLNLSKRLGTSGNPAQSRSEADKSQSDKMTLFRVAPYHPKEPFLYLVPAGASASWPLLDPRFGWVVQQGQSFTLWMGSEVADSEAVCAAVRQHLRWLEKFERSQGTLSEISEGQESVEFWQALGLPSGPPKDRGPVAAHKPEYNADYELLCKLGDAGDAPDEESRADMPLLS